MKRLFSKIQYKNFETGEFIDEKDRTIEEILDLFKSFPWEKQREKIVIDLTNPSITIHGKNNNYIKLAVYFNRKFVLYYLDQEDTLYKKSFVTMEEAHPLIEEFFQTDILNTERLKKENTLFRKNLKHFLSQDFRYEVTNDSSKKFLMSTSSMSFVFSIVILFFQLLKPGSQINFIGQIIIVLMILLIGGGLNLILFFNYYKYANDLVLKMSKGNESFLFGTKENPQLYNKADILQITISKLQNSRNPVNGFCVITLKLNNNRSLNIPNILIEEYALLSKLPGIPRVEKNRFPII